jgi:hypothetical protein
MNQEQLQSVVKCFEATLSPAKDIRLAAEAEIRKVKSLPFNV